MPSRQGVLPTQIFAAENLHRRLVSKISRWVYMAGGLPRGPTTFPQRATPLRLLIRSRRPRRVSCANRLE
jgi:hypothetical protein